MGNNIEPFSRSRPLQNRGCMNNKKIKQMSQKLQQCTAENQNLQKKIKDASASIYNLHMNLEACKAQCSDFSPQPYPLPPF